MADRGGELGFFQDIHITNDLHFHFHKTFGNQNWTAGTSEKVDCLRLTQQLLVTSSW